MKKLFLTMMGFILLGLTACGTNDTYSGGMSPEPPAFKDPSDAQLRADIAAHITAARAPNQSAYDFVRVDLNGDGKRDALVLYQLPHTYWCGWGGCTMAVFQAIGNGFIHRGDITNIRGPVVITDTRTSGWKDIVAELSGSNLSNRLVTLSFNGRGYPANPMNAPSAPYSMLGDVSGMRVFQ